MLGPVPARAAQGAVYAQPHDANNEDDAPALPAKGKGKGSGNAAAAGGGSAGGAGGALVPEPSAAGSQAEGRARSGSVYTGFQGESTADTAC